MNAVSRCESDLITLPRNESDLLTVSMSEPDLLTVSRCEPDLLAGGPGDLYRADSLLFWCVPPGVLVPYLLPVSPALPPLLRYERIAKGQTVLQHFTVARRCGFLLRLEPQIFECNAGLTVSY